VKIKLDENLPASLVEALQQLGHDADSVESEQLVGRDDSKVWTAVQAAGRFLVTQDLDFSDQRRFVPGTHCGLLLVRLSRPGRVALFNRILGLFSTEQVERWAGSLVIATDHKLRVKRTP
jgi:hypothetical protein